MFRIVYKHPDGDERSFNEKELQTLMDATDSLIHELRNVNVDCSDSLKEACYNEIKSLKNLRRIFHYNLNENDID